MQCREIQHIIEERYPKSAALSFDNVGLQAGRNEKEVHTIMVALDATGSVIEAAIEAGVDMLVTHHPLIFSPLKSITDENFISRRLLRLIQQDICYYAMHTNYDVLGMAQLSQKALGLENAEVLDVTAEISGKLEGIGKVGNLPKKMTLKECCEYVKQRLGLENVRVFGNLDTIVEKMAICPGSGKSTIIPAIEKEADVLVTGDIGHHDGLDAIEQGLCIIDAGHYGTEHIFIEDMSMFLKEKLENVNIISESISSPFQVI